MRQPLEDEDTLKKLVHSEYDLYMIRKDLYRTQQKLSFWRRLAISFGIGYIAVMVLFVIRSSGC